MNENSFHEEEFQSKFNKKTIILVVIIAVIFSLVTDFIFVKLLHVLLPRGIFGL